MTRDGSPVEKWLIKKEKNNADGFILAQIKYAKLYERIVDRIYNNSRGKRERGRNHRVRNSFQLVELRKKFDNR